MGFMFPFSRLVSLSNHFPVGELVEPLTFSQPKGFNPLETLCLKSGVADLKYEKQDYTNS